MQTSGGPPRQCQTWHQYYRHSAQEEEAQEEPRIHQLSSPGCTHLHNLSEVCEVLPRLLCEPRDNSADTTGYKNDVNRINKASLGRQRGPPVAGEDTSVQPQQVEVFAHCHSQAVAAFSSTLFHPEERGPHFAGAHTWQQHNSSLEETHLKECAAWSPNPAATFQRSNTSKDILPEQEHGKDEFTCSAFQHNCAVDALGHKHDIFVTPCSRHSNDDCQYQKDVASMHTAIGTPPAAVSCTTLDLKLLQQQQQFTLKPHALKERHDFVVEQHTVVEADSQQKGSNTHTLPREGRLCKGGHGGGVHYLSLPPRHIRSHLAHNATGSAAAAVAAAAVSEIYLVRDQQTQQNAQVFQHAEGCVHGQVRDMGRPFESNNLSVRNSAAAVSVGKRESSSRAAARAPAKAVIDDEGTASICVRAQMAPSPAAANGTDETLVIPNAVDLWSRLQKTKLRMEALQAQRKEEKQRTSRPPDGLSREGAQERDRTKKKRQERGGSKEKLQERLQPTQVRTPLPQQLEKSFQRASEAEEALKYTEQKLLEKEEFAKLLQDQVQQLMRSATEQHAELVKVKEECQQARKAVKDFEKNATCHLQRDECTPDERGAIKRPTDRQVQHMESHLEVQQLQHQSLSNNGAEDVARTAAGKSQGWQDEAVPTTDTATQQQLEKEVKKLQMQLQEAHQHYSVMQEKLSASQKETAHQQELQETLSALVMNAEARVKQAEHCEKQQKQLIGQLQSDLQRQAAESERERQWREEIKQQLDDHQGCQRASEELQQLLRQCRLQQQELECRLIQRQELDTELNLLAGMKKTQWLQEVARKAVLAIEVQVLSSVCQRRQHLHDQYVETSLRRTEQAQLGQGNYHQEKQQCQELGDRLPLPNYAQQDKTKVLEGNRVHLSEQHVGWERSRMRQEELERLLFLGDAREQQMRKQQIEQQNRHEGQLRELQERLSRALEALGKPQQQRMREQQGEHLRRQLNRHGGCDSVSLDTSIEHLGSTKLNPKESTENEVGNQGLVQNLRTQLERIKEEMLTLQKSLQETAQQRDSLYAKLQQALQVIEVEKQICPHPEEIQQNDEEAKQQSDTTERSKQLERQLLSMREELQQQRAQHEVVERDYCQRLHNLKQEYEERIGAEVAKHERREPEFASSCHNATPQQQLTCDKNAQEGEEKGREDQNKPSIANIERGTSITGLEVAENETTSQEWRNKFRQSEENRKQALQQVEELQRQFDAQTALLQRDQERLKRRREAYAAVLRQHLRSDDHLTPLQLQQLFLSTLGSPYVGDKDGEGEERGQHLQVQLLQQQLHEERERALTEAKRQQKHQQGLENQLQQMEELNISLRKRLQDQEHQRNSALPAASTCKVDTIAVEESEIAQCALLLKSTHTTRPNAVQCTPAPVLPCDTSPPQVGPGYPVGESHRSIGRACGFEGISCGRTLDDFNSLLCNDSLACNRPRQLRATAARNRPRPHTASEVPCGTEQPSFPSRRWSLVQSLFASNERLFSADATPGEARVEDCQHPSNPEVPSHLAGKAPQVSPADRACLCEALTVEVETLQDLLQIRDRDTRVLLNFMMREGILNHREHLSLNTLYEAEPNGEHIAALDCLSKEMDAQGENIVPAYFLKHLTYFTKHKLQTSGQMRSAFQARLLRQKAADAVHGISQYQHKSQVRHPSSPYTLRPSPLSEAKKRVEHQQQQQQLGVLMALKRSQNVAADGQSFLTHQQPSLASTCMAVPEPSVERFFRPLFARRKQRREQTLTCCGSCAKVTALMDAEAASKDGKSKCASVLASDVERGKVAKFVDLIRHEWKAALRQQRSPQDFFRCLGPARLTAYAFNKTPFSFLVSGSVTMQDTNRLFASLVLPPLSFPFGHGAEGNKRHTRCSSCTSDVSSGAEWQNSSMCISTYENATASGTSDTSNTMQSLPWSAEVRGSDTLKDGKQLHHGGDRPPEPPILARASCRTQQTRNNKTTEEKPLPVYHLSALTHTSQTCSYRYATVDAFPPPDAVPTATPVLLYHLSPGVARLCVEITHDSSALTFLSPLDKCHADGRRKRSSTQAGNGDAPWDQSGKPALKCPTDCKRGHEDNERVPYLRQTPLLARLQNISLISKSRAPLYISFLLGRSHMPVPQKSAKVKEKKQEKVLSSGESQNYGGMHALEKRENFQHCHEGYFVTQLTHAPVDESLLLFHFCTEKVPLTQVTDVAGGIHICPRKVAQTGAVAEQLEGRHFKIQHALSGFYFALATPPGQDSHSGDTTAAGLLDLPSVAAEIEALVAVAHVGGAFSLQSEPVASGEFVFPEGLPSTHKRGEKPHTTSNSQSKGFSELCQLWTGPHHNHGTTGKLGDERPPSNAAAPQISRLIAVPDKEVASPFVFTREASLLEFRVGT